MRTRHINRLWNGLASLRDHEVDRAIKTGGIKLIYQGKIMTLTAQELQTKRFQSHKKKFDSMYYPDQRYTLYDFVFIDDNDKMKKEAKPSKEEELKIMCQQGLFG